MNNISVRHLTKKFKGFTLQDVSFDVPAGSVVGFIGENGAGKSTTIKSILGLVLPDGGNIRVFGKEASALTRADRGRIGAVLGESCLPENLNIKDLSEVMKNIFGEWEEDTYYRLTDAFSLPRDRKIKEFSTGMRQKAALAIALSHRAELLVLDEPASGLDPVARDEILRQLDACREGDITDAEIDGARRTLATNWGAMLDDPLTLERYWLGQAAAGTMVSAEERIAQVQTVDRARIVAAAQATTLDMVYLMKGAAK